MALTLLKNIASKAVSNLTNLASSGANYLKKQAPDVLDRSLMSNPITMPFSKAGQQALQNVGNYFSKQVNPNWQQDLLSTWSRPNEALGSAIDSIGNFDDLTTIPKPVRDTASLFGQMSAGGLGGGVQGSTLGLLNPQSQYSDALAYKVPKALSSTVASTIPLSQGGSTIANLFGKSIAPATIQGKALQTAFSPKFIGAQTAIGTGFSGGAKMLENMMSGKPLSENVLETMGKQAPESLLRAPQMGAIVGTTNPAIEYVGKYVQGSKAFQNLSPTIKAQVLDRLIGSVSNVVEGVGMDKAMGFETDATSLATDAGTGALFGTNAVKGLNDPLKRSLKEQADLLLRSIGDEGGFIKGTEDAVKPETKPEGMTDIKTLVARKLEELNTQKSTSTPIDVEQTREFGISKPVDSMNDTELRSLFDKKRISKKYKIDPKELDRVQTEYGISPAKFEKVLAQDSDNPAIKDRLAYAISRIQTKNFTQEVFKKIRFDTNANESLLTSEPDLTSNRKINEIATGSGYNPYNINERLTAQSQAPKVEPINTPKGETTIPKVKATAPKVDTAKTLYEKATTTKDKKSWDDTIGSVTSYVTGIRSSLESKGLSFEKLVDQIESGTIAKEYAPYATKVTEFFDTFNKVGTERRNIVTGQQTNYFRRIGEDQIADMTKTLDKSVGDILFDAGYAKERKGTMTDYIKDERAMIAYAMEAMGSPDPSVLKKQQLAQEIINEVRGIEKQIEGEATKTAENKGINAFEALKKNAKKNADVLKDKSIEYFERIQNKMGLPKTETYETNQKEYLWDKLLRSVDDRVAKYGGDKFYNAFLDPWKKAQYSLGQYTVKLKGMDLNALRDEYIKNTDKTVDESWSKELLIDMLSGQKRRSLTSKATDMFTQNVATAKIKNAQLIGLVNDIGNTYITQDLVTNSIAKKVAGIIRAQTGRGALGLNVASAVNNIFEIKRVASSVSTKALMSASKRLGETNVVEKYGLDSKRDTALERKYGKGIYDKIGSVIDPVLFKMFDSTEKFKDKFMILGFEEQGKLKNLQGENLRKYVQQKFSEYAVKYGKGQDIGLFQSPLMKTIAQFQQYAIKDAVIFGDRAKGVFKDRGDRAYIAKYIGFSVLQGAIMKATLNTIGFGGQTGTPWDLYSSLIDGDSKFAPIATLAWDLGTELASNPNTEDEYTRDQRMSRINKNATLMSVPASNQVLNKTYQYKTNQDRGYFETGSGNVANEVSTDPVSQAKGYIFGGAYDPKRQEYSRAYGAGEQPYMNKDQTRIYNSLPDKDAKTSYYDSSKKQDVANQNLTKALETEDKQMSWWDKAKGKKEAQIGLPLPTKEATEQERKQFQSDFDKIIETGNYDAITEEHIKERYFRTNAGDSKDYSKRSKAYSSLYKMWSDEDVPDTYKEQLVKASKVDPSDWDYYKFASMDKTEQLQTIATVMDGIENPDERIITLAYMKRQVYGKQGVNNTDTDYLYDMGVLSKDEKKLIDNIKFDPLYNKFYMDRDYEGSGGMSESQRKAYINKVNGIFKDTIKKSYGESSEISKLINSFAKNIKIPEWKAPRMANKGKGSSGRWFTPY